MNKPNSLIKSLKALNSFIETVTEALKVGDDVQLVGFGSFQVKQRAAREDAIRKQARLYRCCCVPSFKAGKTLKEAVK
ncbi:HU family DNA-binding protein [Arsenophonus nasoniae]|uniref:DNA-binding protein HU-beta n=1 Tax=Arsenophonus nasoniae TaxID=638 RepID=A0A4P7LB80_9GAMM|nr:HU family DNA-binding protein [Arsenophonus nasoniae]QBY46382.1 DNA-binding protein HU-beta [Arsenophonus nasoniae]